MSSANAEVMALVESALAENPELTARELRQRAREIDQRVEQLSGRQFHALYALPARRRLFGPKRKTKPKSDRGSAAGASVQELLVQSYRERKSRLNEALDSAFEQAMEEESLARLNEFLSSIDRKAAEFGQR